MNFKIIIFYLALLSAFLGLWSLLVFVADIPRYILPSPFEILQSFKGYFGETWRNYSITLVESFFGLVLGSMLGFAFGVGMAQFRLFRKMSLPFLIGSNAIPVVAIAPILIIWFGSGLFSKIAVSSFISFFPIALNTYRGLCEFRPAYEDLFRIYGASKKEFLLKYKMGNAIPFIFTGLRLNATLSVIGSIVGEFVSADKGIGFAILQAGYNFNSPKLWGYIMLACSIGILFYALAYLAETLFFRNYKSS